MTAPQPMVHFLNPVAPPLREPNEYNLVRALTPGTRLAMVVNAIVDCRTFMDAVGEAIQDLRPGIELAFHETGTFTYAAANLIEQIAIDHDAAICAIGHCGSCTAGTVKDGIHLIERGLPAVSLITEPFWEQTEALSRSLGWPDAPHVKLPYPVWGTGLDTMSQTAKAAAPAIINALECDYHARTP